MSIYTRRVVGSGHGFFSEKWNFHHVYSALDRKLVRILAPPGSGSVYYNYKNYFPIIMLALIYADYKFMYFNVHGDSWGRLRCWHLQGLQFVQGTG